MAFNEKGFAESIGLRRAYYWNIELGRRHLRLRMMLKVAAGQKLGPPDLLREAGSSGPVGSGYS
jgi:hypothetical protein